MTPYQLKDGNRVHNLDTDDLIKRANVMWAKLEKPGRVHMIEYTRVKFMTEYEFTCAEPPKEKRLAIWRPTIEIPITELGNYSKGVPGISVAWSSVNLVLRMPVAA